MANELRRLAVGLSEVHMFGVELPGLGKSESRRFGPTSHTKEATLATCYTIGRI